jgi:hypothetical protein
VTVVRRVLAVGAAALVVSACGSTGSSPTAAPSQRDSSAPHPFSTPSEPAISDETVGSQEHASLVTPTQQLLPWKPVPGPTDDLVTVGDGWTLTVPRGDSEAELRGHRSMTIQAGEHASVTEAFLDNHYAVVVIEDRLAHDPDRAVVVDLATGKTRTLDARSNPPTAVGGTWALGEDSVVHATQGQDRSYCLATVDLATGRGTTGWCAEPRHGFSRASVTSDGTSMMTFDDHHPSCRTLVTVDGGQTDPLPGVPDCKGWDSSLVSGATVWSVVPNERRIEAAHFYAHADQGWYDLGPGTSGTLVTCAGSAYFVRDPQRSTDPARLLRWDPSTASLATVFESKGHGRAFLAAPRCGGDQLTVSSYSSAGDQQVTARLN